MLLLSHATAASKSGAAAIRRASDSADGKSLSPTRQTKLVPSIISSIPVSLVAVFHSPGVCVAMLFSDWMDEFISETMHNVALKSTHFFPFPLVYSFGGRD